MNTGYVPTDQFYIITYIYNIHVGILKYFIVFNLLNFTLHVSFRSTYENCQAGNLGNIFCAHLECFFFFFKTKAKVD